jgi:hypothetical protein
MSVIPFDATELGNVAAALAAENPADVQPFVRGRLAAALGTISIANAQAYTRTYGEQCQPAQVSEIAAFAGSPDLARAEGTAGMLAYNCVSNGGTDFGEASTVRRALAYVADELTCALGLAAARKAREAAAHANEAARQAAANARAIEVRDIDAGHHATIVPGESITLYGVDCNRYVRNATTGNMEAGEVRYARTFRIGEIAEWGSYNLSYMGTIVAIGRKTVTIEDHGSKHRLALAKFAWRNRHFNAEAAQRQNAAWMD